MVPAVHVELVDGAPSQDHHVLPAPLATMQAPAMTAFTGPAQKPRTSHPLAWVQPAISATALAKLPPPRWFMSPAASEHSTTKSTLRHTRHLPEGAGGQ